MSISTTIKSIQDIMRKDVGVDGDAQRIGQLVWMFFLKIFDDKEAEYELLDDDYRSPIPARLRWRNGAADAEGIIGDELLDFINNELFPELKNLQPRGNDKRAYVIRSVFEDAYNYMKSGHLMRQVINRIVAGLDFNKVQDRHLFGDVYEQILRDLQNAGNAGEYYTPRPVTAFMVDRVAPQLGEKVLDPACGTGGFLTCAIEYLRTHHVKTVEDEKRLQESIFGVEKKPLPHLLATTNMILHGLDVPTNVRHDNTLARPLRDYGPRDRVDVIVTNPPFGGMEEDGIETNFPANFRTRETADLFLVLIMHLLKDGDRAAVVLPDGTLFGEGIKTRIKEQLLATCNLHTVVRLATTLVPLPPLPEQHRIVARVDELMALCDRLEAEQTDAAEAHARLVEALLATLTASRDAADCAANWQRLSEHFDTLFTTEASIAALKQTVLQLAVMGRLVPQDPTDEPASELLKRIEAEKARLAKEGKIRKAKVVEVVGEHERPYHLPSGWEWIRMDHLDPSYQNGESSRGEINGIETTVLRLADIKNGSVSLEDTRSIAVSASSTEKYSLHAGDLLAIRVNGSGEIVGRFVLCEENLSAIYCDHFIRIRIAGSHAFNRYIRLLSDAPVVRAQIQSLFITTAGQKTVNQGHLGGLLFPLPPLPEQDRIVAKVDELMALCDRLQTALANAREHRARLADTLVQAALEAA